MCVYARTAAEGRRERGGGGGEGGGGVLERLGEGLGWVLPTQRRLAVLRQQRRHDLCNVCVCVCVFIHTHSLSHTYMHVHSDIPSNIYRSNRLRLPQKQIKAGGVLADEVGGLAEVDGAFGARSLLLLLVPGPVVCVCVCVHFARALSCSLSYY